MAFKVGSHFSWFERIRIGYFPLEFRLTLILHFESFQFVVLCGLVAVASAGLLPAITKTIEVDSPPHYDFSYSVQDPHTGDVKQQQESRANDVVQGSYSLIEPDGHRRVVHYTADDHNGFNAVVQREGTVHQTPVHAAAVVSKQIVPVQQHYVQPAVAVKYAQPQIAIAQPQIAIAHAQPQIAIAQPQLTYAHAQPQIAVAHAQPAYALGHQQVAHSSSSLTFGGQAVSGLNGYAVNGYGLGQGLALH